LFLKSKQANKQTKLPLVSKGYRGQF
jgi:hypothetical protein